MATYTAIVTNDGRQLLAAAAAGEGEVFPVRINTGDGILGSTDPTELSNLVHPVESFLINSSNALVPYQASFRFEINSTEVFSTYLLREVGLIASLNLDGPETLLCYSYTTDSPDTITPGTGDSATIDFNTLTIAFSSTPNTVATLVAEVPPPLHAVTHLHRLDGSSPDPIPTANSNDYGLCPQTPNDPNTVLCGGTTAGFSLVPPHAPRHCGGAADPLPLSTTAASGALRALSGNATDVLLGTGNWGAGFFPGFITEYGGNSAPAGWLLCDGNSYPTSTYPALFAAIGYSHGGSGANFNVPDCRGRATVGAGNGPGLTPRGLGAKGGTETHTLSPAEMPVHSHFLNDPGHAHSVYDPTHGHSLADGGHAHSVYDLGHKHLCFFSTNADTGTPRPGIDSTPTWGYVSGVDDYSVAYGHAPIWLAEAWTSTNSANVGIYAAGTGIGVYGNYTGIGIYPAGTGISLQNAGSGQPHLNMSPFIVLNKIIKV